MLSRTREGLDPLEGEIDGARGFECDVASADSVARAFARIRADLESVDTLIYNADKPESFFIKPSAVAETAFTLTCQDASAWSFEVEARPFAESW